jgi:opacity protein-like surface antigen
MNKSIYAFAAAALLCMSAAQAAPQAAAPANDPSVQISSAKTHYKMYASDFANYAGAYQLDNGDVIKLKQVGLHYYTQLYGQDRVEIIALRSGVFATADGTVLTFSNDNDTLTINGPDLHQVASR